MIVFVFFSLGLYFYPGAAAAAASAAAAAIRPDRAGPPGRTVTSHRPGKLKIRLGVQRRARGPPATRMPVTVVGESSTPAAAAPAAARVIVEGGVRVRFTGKPQRVRRPAQRLLLPGALRPDTIRVTGT
jgi:hypothetical protein